MSLLSALNVDLVVNRMMGSAHPKGNIGQGQKDQFAKEPTQLSLQDSDVRYSPATQRAKRILDVELSVSLSSQFSVSSTPVSPAARTVSFADLKVTRSMSSVQSDAVRSHSDSLKFAQTFSATALSSSFSFAVQDPTSGVELETDGEFDVEEIANTVLGFVEDRIQEKREEGATDEALLILTDQAKQGVLTGISEAKKVLESLQGLSQALDQDLDRLQTRMSTDIDNLVAKTSPSPMLDEIKPASANRLVPVDSRLESIDVDSVEKVERRERTERVQKVEKESINERFFGRSQKVDRSDQFSMEVVTRDGDKISIAISQDYRFRDSRQIGGDRFAGDSHDYYSQSSLFSRSNLTYHIKGELDDGERRALDELFEKVNTLADQFYSGDMAAAVETALKFEMDLSELQSMQLSMSSQQAVRMQESYRQVAQLPASQLLASNALANNLFADTLANPMSGKVDANVLSDLLNFLDRVATERDELYKNSVLQHAGQLVNDLLPEAIAAHPNRSGQATSSASKVAPSESIFESINVENIRSLLQNR